MLQDQFAAFNLDPALAEMVEAAAPEQLLEGVLRLDDPASPPPAFLVVSKFNRICTGRFRAADAWEIRRHPNVISLKAARPLGIHEDDGDSSVWTWQSLDASPELHPRFTGRGSIVAALDFGLDFAHPNFLNRDGTTRVIAFWHQGAEYDSARPNRFGYGREYSSEEINAALRTPDPYRALGYHPAASDTGLGSHGTHTLDIAAGNGRARGSTPSAAPDADIIFVHLSTPRLDTVGDLGDSVRLLEALDYVDKVATGRPWVANLSVGRTAGSHDGTSLVEQGMHELLRLGPSKAIVQSAGNYRSANLAVEGWLRDGEIRDLAWKIDPADTTGNEMDAWYSGRDRFVIAIRAPGERAFTHVKLGEVADLEYRGATVGRVYHRRDDPNNHDNHFEVFLHEGSPAGTWTVRLIGKYVISGRFHAWIERDLSRPGAQSRFDTKITSPRYTLGTIATSPLPITVGAYDARSDDKLVAHFSSSGPTRDERSEKPELLAPGVKVIAARSIPRHAARQEGLLIARSGTSMAAPHVTGTVAAMFEAAGRPVSIDEIRECLKRSAEPMRAGKHANHCAWGRLDTAKAIRSIRALKHAGAGDAANPYVEQQNGLHLDEGVDMKLDAQEQFLDGAERALEVTGGDRRQSESGFLSGLFRALDSGVSNAGLSPAALYRAVVQDSPLMNHARDVLDVLGLPSQRPEGALRPGDWMLRAVPGTGDVGHVAVLASGDLLTASMVATEDISAEGVQPGYYGVVIEAGAFPHDRARPFARRLLDSRGRVSPHTVILRPRYPQMAPAPDFPPDDPDLSGAGEDYTQPQLDGCKKKWLAFLNTFHEDVRKAIASNEPAAAVLMAIHHGQRDLQTLRRLSFDAKYGGERGYCPVARSEQRYIGAWDAEKGIVIDLLARPTLPKAQSGGVVCQKVERRYEDAKPDAPKVDITGRYEHSYVDPTPPKVSITDFTLNLNQAGRHVEGHITEVLRPGTQKDRTTTRFHGDLQADGSFLIYSIERPDNFWGYLIHEQRGSKGSLYLQRMSNVDPKSVAARLRFEKHSDAPTLMEWAFSDEVFPGWGPVYQNERWPLTRAQIRNLAAGFSEDVMAPLLKNYFSTPYADRVAERKALSAAALPLDKHIEEIFRHRINGIHKIDRPLGSYYARNILSQNKWTHKQITRSLLDWLQIALDVMSGFGYTMSAATTYLGLSSKLGRGQKPVDPTTQLHKYKVTFSLERHWVFLYKGWITVEKTTGTPWNGTFKIALKGIQVKPGSIKESGEAETYYDWSELDIPGDVELVTGKVGAKTPGVKASAGAWFMHIFGSNYLPYLDVLGTDVDAKLNAGKSFKFDGINLGGLWGEIYSKKLPDKDYSKFLPAPDYVAHYNLKNDTHFCLGSALLTEDARQALRIVCANELAVFQLPDSTLKIVGHADRVDTDERNYELSKMRAMNTLRALVDVLGDRFRIPKDNIKLHWKGEEEAAIAQPKGQKPDPKFRRVDVYLNARLVISLKAA